MSVIPHFKATPLLVAWHLMFKLTNFSRTAPTVLAADWPNTPAGLPLKTVVGGSFWSEAFKNWSRQNNHSTAGYILALTGMLREKIDLIFSWVRIRKKGSRKSNFVCRREQRGIGNNSEGAHVPILSRSLQADSCISRNRELDILYTLKPLYLTIKMHLNTHTFRHHCFCDGQFCFLCVWECVCTAPL